MCLLVILLRRLVIMIVTFVYDSNAVYAVKFYDSDIACSEVYDSDVNLMFMIVMRTIC